MEASAGTVDAEAAGLRYSADDQPGSSARASNVSPLYSPARVSGLGAYLLKHPSEFDALVHQEFVERTLLQSADGDASTDVLWHPCIGQHQWDSIRAAQSHRVHCAFAGQDVEDRRDQRGRYRRRDRNNLNLRRLRRVLHLIQIAERRHSRDGFSMGPDEGPATVTSNDEPLDLEIGQRATDGHSTDAELFDEIHLLR